MSFLCSIIQEKARKFNGNFQALINISGKFSEIWNFLKKIYNPTAYTGLTESNGSLLPGDDLKKSPVGWLPVHPPVLGNE